MVGHRHDLPPEQLPEHPIRAGRLIHRRDVHQLVVHQDVHPLVARNRLEREVERRDLDGDDVAGHHRRAGVARIRDVGEQQNDRIARVKVEELPLKGERVEKRARGMRHQERLGWIEIHEAQPRHLEDRELRGRRSRQSECEEECRSAPLRKAHAAGIIGEKDQGKTKKGKGEAFLPSPFPFSLSYRSSAAANCCDWSAPAKPSARNAFTNASDFSACCRAPVASARWIA